MSTRGRIARNEHQQEFEGHVQRWVKQWEPLGGTSKVKILKWVPTGERLLRTAAHTLELCTTYHKMFCLVDITQIL